MKLTRSQVKALAIKLQKDYRKEVLDPVKRYNQSIKESKEYKDFIKNDKLCQQLEPYIDGEYCDAISMQKVIRHRYFKDKFKDEPSVPYTDHFENAIDLATIDSNTVEELTKLVKEVMWK